MLFLSCKILHELMWLLLLLKLNYIIHTHISHTHTHTHTHTYSFRSKPKYFFLSLYLILSPLLFDLCLFVYYYFFFGFESNYKSISRAGHRLRQIRPLPRVPLLQKAPNLGANLFIYFLYINIFERY